MIIPDINLLVYAHNQDDIRYQSARIWWDSLLEGDVTIELPLAVSVGFVRLATNPRVMSPQMTSEQVVSLVRSWLHRSSVISLTPTLDTLTTSRTASKPRAEPADS